MKQLKRSRKEALYRRFVQKKFIKYKAMFPKLRQSCILQKILKQWLALTEGEKIELMKNFIRMEGRTHVGGTQKTKIISKQKKIYGDLISKVTHYLDDIYPIFQEKVKVRVFKENKYGLKHNVGQSLNWIQFYGLRFRYLDQSWPFQKKMCVCKIFWHIMNLHRSIGMATLKKASNQMIILKTQLDSARNMLQQVYKQDVVQDKIEEIELNESDFSQTEYIEQKVLTDLYKKKRQSKRNQTYLKLMVESTKPEKKKDDPALTWLNNALKGSNPRYDDQLAQIQSECVNQNQMMVINQNNVDLSGDADENKVVIINQNNEVYCEDSNEEKEVIHQEDQQQQQEHQSKYLNEQQLKIYFKQHEEVSQQDPHYMQKQLEQAEKQEREFDEKYNKQLAILKDGYRKDLEQMYTKKTGQIINPGQIHITILEKNFDEKQVVQLNEKWQLKIKNSLSDYDKSKAQIKQRIQYLYQLSRQQAYANLVKQKQAERERVVIEARGYDLKNLETFHTKRPGMRPVYENPSQNLQKQLKNKTKKQRGKIPKKRLRTRLQKPKKSNLNQDAIQYCEIDSKLHQSSSSILIVQPQKPKKIKKTKKERQNEKNARKRQIIRKIRLQSQLDPTNKEAVQFTEKIRAKQRQKAKKKRLAKSRDNLKQKSLDDYSITRVASSHYFDKVEEKGRLEQQLMNFVNDIDIAQSNAVEEMRLKKTSELMKKQMSPDELAIQLVNMERRIMDERISRGDDASQYKLLHDYEIARQLEKVNEELRKMQDKNKKK